MSESGREKLILKTDSALTVKIVSLKFTPVCSPSD
jgi:hypothetical protein